MTDTHEFKQLLMSTRRIYTETNKAIKEYIGKEVRIQNPDLELPRYINTYQIEYIDVSENNVCLSWLDEDENDRILEDITIKQFVENAEFV
ncbi:hypothetical protein [Paenibacillus lactis]|uniref:hypothetical protein n=1 Tax=Paenibacillus lactis TaxID=228574 RepID=UPI003D7247DF